MDPTNRHRSEDVEPEQDHPEVIALPPLIYLAGLVPGLILEWLLPLGVAFGIAWRLFGGALMALSLGLAIWADRTLLRAGTHVYPKLPAKVLVTHGPFRYSRNPIYLGLTGFYIGLSLVLGALWPLLLLPWVLGAMHFGVIVREERYLERKFGQEYLEYKARVRRWL